MPPIRTSLSVSRVQTPTLAMLAERDGKIMLFQKEKYHHVHLNLGDMEAVSEKIQEKTDADTMQRKVNRIFGYTAKQTLDNVQSLYEKKLLTYPRTDSRYLTSDMAETASYVAHLAAKLAPFSSCSNFSPDVGVLSGGERNVFLLVCCKLMCAVAEPYVFEIPNTKILLSIGKNRRKS